jgi:hypothetical protein
MSNFVNTPHNAPLSVDSNVTIDQRLLRTMVVTTLVAVGLTPFFASWRVATGVFLGGALALVNHRWMKSSIASAFSSVTAGTAPNIGVAKFVLRYLVIGLTVYAAYVLNIVSLPATILGLCTFVVALFFEAGREFYFTIVASRGN